MTRSSGAPQARLYLGRIAPLAPQDAAALRLLAGLLSDRMRRTLREERGLAYRLGASVSLARERAWMTLSAGTRKKNVPALLQGLRRQMERLRNRMAPAGEIERVRATLESRSLMREMTAVNRARTLGLRAFTGLPADDSGEALAALGRVPAPRLEELAREWLDYERYRIVILR